MIKEIEFCTDDTSEMINYQDDSHCSNRETKKLTFNLLSLNNIKFNFQKKCNLKHFLISIYVINNTFYSNKMLFKNNEDKKKNIFCFSNFFKNIFSF